MNARNGVWNTFFYAFFFWFVQSIIIYLRYVWFWLSELWWCAWFFNGEFLFRYAYCSTGIPKELHVYLSNCLVNWMNNVRISDIFKRWSEKADLSGVFFIRYDCYFFVRMVFSLLLHILTKTLCDSWLVYLRSCRMQINVFDHDAFASYSSGWFM